MPTAVLAVIGVLEGAHIAAVGTAPGEGHDPATNSLWGHPERPSEAVLPLTPAIRARTPAQVRQLVAGEVAAVILTGEPLPAGRASDYADAGSWASLLLGDGGGTIERASMRDFISEREPEVRQFLARPDVWEHVTAIAAELERCGGTSSGISWQPSSPTESSRCHPYQGSTRVDVVGER